MPRKLLVGGLQRNGTLRSSTIKKVPPPVVPGAGINPRHSSSSSGSSSTSSSGYGSQPDRAPCNGTHHDDGSREPPPPSPGLDYGDQTPTFCRPDTFPDGQVAPLSRPRSHPGTPVSTPTTPLPPGLPTGRGCYVPIGGGSLDDTPSITGGGTTLGRDSPSGGSVESRHSSSSLDSGRGSSSSSSADSKVAHRLSSGSHGSASSLTLTSSVSSQMSSLTPDIVVLSPVNVASLLLNGVPDTEVLTTWLKNLHFEEYAQLFLQAGYDMPTISRMTPEDLTAIGITKPAHRRKLKAEISKLNISDGIPDYKPDNLLIWLRLLRLEQYYGSLCQQGYTTVDRVSDLTWEDLEDIGIQKLGHQKKMMLAIKKIRDLNRTAPRHASIYAEARHASVDMGQLLTPRQGSHVRMGHESQYHAMHPAAAPEAQEVAIATSRAAASRGRNSGCGEPEALQLRTFRQPSPPRSSAQTTVPPSSGSYFHQGSSDSLLPHHPQFPPPPTPQHYQHDQGTTDWYQHDFVSMQVRSPNRGRSLESLEDSGGNPYYPPPHPAGVADWYGTVSSWRQHGYDTDSELVRQPSLGSYDCYEPDGTATLHRPRGLVRPRPVAKVAARALLDAPSAELEAKAELLADWADSDYGAPTKHVAPPPAPPKRTNSIRRQEADNMAEAAFATCVQSLTSRFTMATQDEPPLPPPPPPCEEVAPPPCGSEDSSPSGTLVRRKDSGGSSVSSESLPFANENVGTIKQRPPGEGGPPGNPMNGNRTNGNPLGPSSPVKEKGPPAVMDCGSSPEDVPVRDVPQDYRPGKDKPTSVPRPAAQVLSSRHSDKLSVVSSSHGVSAPPSSSSGDVIDDIEHMLASLTDQLDAMLECELSS
uniref:SAM domain-containing protein n=1 Tax=Ornithodoros turicata TaxID=34597 RepID=A0A2R5LJP5_9ACAR